MRANLIAIAFACMAFACHADPSNHPRLVDEQGADVDYACVVPLYRKVSGVAWGVEGKADFSSDLYLMRPFRFVSESDFLANIVPWGRNMLPFGVMSFGDGWELVGRLLLHKGHVPITPKLFNKYVEKTLVMPRGKDQEAEDALAIVLATPPDQDKLRKLFGVKDPIRVELRPEDIQLLRSCVGGERAPIEE